MRYIYMGTLVLSLLLRKFYDIIEQMMPKGLVVIGKFVIIGSFLLSLSLIHNIDVAGAPLNTNSKLESKVLADTESINARIDILCEAYNFPYFTLMKWLAFKESSTGQNKDCGDEGKSCGLFQYKQPTWELFQKEFQRYDLHRDDTDHQIQMTIIALQNGKWKHWSPLNLKYNSNPIK